MKITIKRSGGFTGISMPPKVLETDDDVIKALAREVMSSASDDTLVDGMQYDITVEEDGNSKSVCLQGEGEKLSRLVNEVLK